MIPKWIWPSRDGVGALSRDSTLGDGLSGARAVLDKSDTEIPFSPSGSFCATAPASRRGMG